MVSIINSGIVFSNATIYVLFNNWVILVDNDLAVPSRSRFNLRNFLNVIVRLGPAAPAGKFLEKKDENC